jgi:hypothetical protein
MVTAQMAPEEEGAAQAALEVLDQRTGIPENLPEFRLPHDPSSGSRSVYVIL